MRTFLCRAVLAASCLLCAAVTGGAQEVRVVGIVPEKPAPGSAFVVTVEVPGTSADTIEPMEPELAGPVRYDGADVRPVDGDLSSALVSYRFTATGPGRVDVRKLSVRVRGRTIQLGAWVIEVVQGSLAPVRRYGSWSAPDTVWAGQSFVVKAHDPEGRAAVCPPFAVEGAIVEPLPGNSCVYSVAVFEPGSWKLPQLELEDASGKYTLKTREIAIKTLPSAASGTKAIGGPWTLVLVAPRQVSGARPGDTIAWEIHAIMDDTSSFAEPPSISVAGPAGEPLALDPGTRFHTESSSARTVVGARGVFTVTEPGEYSIRPQPYSWFDTDSGTVRKAFAPAVRFTVMAPAPKALEPPAALVEFASRTLVSVGGAGRKDDQGLAAVHKALQEGDWLEARTALYRYLSIPEERGALARLELKRKEALLAALVGFLAGDRAEAYGILLRLEKSAFPPAGISMLADEAAAYFGNLDRGTYVVPPFGFLALAGAFALMIAALGLFTKQRYAMVAVFMAALLAGAAAVSVGERSVKGFVSLGAVARNVPSIHASGAYTLEEGKSGRVLENAGDWLFVEPDGSEAAWISVYDVIRY